MKRAFVILAVAILLPAIAFAQEEKKPQPDPLKFVAAQDLMIINQGFDNTEMTFSRLPEDLKDETRKAVWDLGLNSAGIAVRFSTDSKRIGVKWTLLNNFFMNHMASTGIRGIDFYFYGDDGKWHFVATAQPSNKAENEKTVLNNLDGSEHEFMAYLPLYDGVKSVEIGVDQEATIDKPHISALTKNAGKPIVVYGTSIAQGGCASRPGMVYSSILSRELNKEVINLGFSGNARMDFALAKMCARIDAESYIVDCLENCTTQTLRDSAYNWIVYLAKQRPEAKIYMVENIEYCYGLIDVKTAADVVEKNAYWKELFDQLVGEGYKNLIYIDKEGLTGPDTEGSVDGAHQTDLGFRRMADKFLQYIK